MRPHEKCDTNNFSPMPYTSNLNISLFSTHLCGKVFWYFKGGASRYIRAPCLCMHCYEKCSVFSKVFHTTVDHQSIQLPRNNIKNVYFIYVSYERTFWCWNVENKQKNNTCKKYFYLLSNREWTEISKIGLTVEPTNSNTISITIQKTLRFL